MFVSEYKPDCYACFGYTEYGRNKRVIQKMADFGVMCVGMSIICVLSCFCGGLLELCVLGFLHRKTDNTLFIEVCFYLGVCHSPDYKFLIRVPF